MADTQPSGWAAFKHDWLGVDATQKPPPPKPKPGGKKAAQAQQQKTITYAVLAVVALATGHHLLAAFPVWWDTRAIPWLNDWKPHLIVAAVATTSLTILAVYQTWFAARFERAAQARAEKRQPPESGVTPKVKADRKKRQVEEIDLPYPDGSHPTPADVRRDAEIHGLDTWGSVADAAVSIDPETARTKVKLTAPADTTIPDRVLFPFDDIARNTHHWDDPDVLAYGVTAGGEPQTWDLNRRPHALVAGETGSGKSGVLTAMIIMALVRGWRVVLLDPKKRVFRHLDGLPNLERYGDAKGLDSQRQLAKAILAVHAEMESRNDLTDEQLAGRQRILLVIDELHELWAGLNRLHAAEKEEAGQRATGQHPCIGLLEEIGTLAREVMIHLLFAIQRPDAKVAGGLLRAQLGNRISVGPLERDGAIMMHGNEHVKLAKEVPEIKGRVLAPGPVGKPGPRQAQVWWCDLKDRHVVGQVRELILSRGFPQVEPLVKLSPHVPATDDDIDDTPVDVTKPPAKKAPTRAHKKPAVAASGDGPDILGHEAVLADEIQRNDWIVIQDNGATRNVQVLGLEGEDPIVMRGFDWSREFDPTDTLRRLIVDDGTDG